MEPNGKAKLDITRVLITAAIVLAAAGVVGGTTWYVMDKSAKEIKVTNEKTVSELQKQIDALNLKVTTTTTTTTPTTTDIKTLDLQSLTGEDKSMGKFFDTIYADVNNDTKDEAVLTFQIDGTGGYKDYFIYGLDGTSAKLLYSKKGIAHGQMNLLKNNIGIYIQYIDSNDPINLGKPNSDMVLSKQISATWNGSIFVESGMSLY